MPGWVPHVVVISGSVRRPSRSRLLDEAVAAAALERFDLNVESFDLIDAGPGLGAAFTRDELTPEAASVVAAIETADALIAVSPVYKGSYTGLFKRLFDFVAPAKLVNKPVVIAATGGGHRHGLVVEHQMRPLFGFFSALTVPTSVYASDEEFRNGELVESSVLERVDQAGAQLAALLGSRRPNSGPVSAPRLRASAA
jgi:FMN reductase